MKRHRDGLRCEKNSGRYAWCRHAANHQAENQIKGSDPIGSSAVRNRVDLKMNQSSMLSPLIMLFYEKILWSQMASALFSYISACMPSDEVYKNDD
jgi:hypothetical protein